MASSEKAMTDLNVDFGNETDEVAEVILSKSEMQKKKTLKDIKFSDYKGSIEKIHTETYVGIRVTIKDELYGYDIPIPEGQKIYADKTVVQPKKDEIQVKIFKETKFSLKKAMMS
ncbi:uncharacterized protein LOC133189095 [Saccostrea echinata]|uniref:uncharacterized protein LOC133189095 n=1 Tax=Saccostrea echinata TaxID=191078 RepID=UPI002A83E94B|nr:uncharacterized protein LOC133189095 [Saccostrea echinata]